MSGELGVFAPARVDLSPGFTDVEPLCAELPARIVNVALDLGVTVTVTDGPPAPPSVPGTFVDRLLREIECRLDLRPQAVRFGASPLPQGSGLGASGALSLALAYALSLRAGASIEPVDVVALACTAERAAGLTGGTQDQLASMYGGAGLVRRHDGLGERHAIEADLAALGRRLVLVRGDGTRNSGSIIEQVLHARPRAAVLDTIAAMNDVAERMVPVLRDGAFDSLAGLVNDSAALLHALHPDITGDDRHRRLRDLGAAAAKPCGAGGPGAAWVALVEPDRRADFVSEVTSAGWHVLPGGPAASGAVRR